MMRVTESTSTSSSLILVFLQNIIHYWPIAFCTLEINLFIRNEVQNQSFFDELKGFRCIETRYANKPELIFQKDEQSKISKSSLTFPRQRRV